MLFLGWEHCPGNFALCSLGKVENYNFIKALIESSLITHEIQTNHMLGQFWKLKQIYSMQSPINEYVTLQMKSTSLLMLEWGWKTNKLLEVSIFWRHCLRDTALNAPFYKMLKSNCYVRLIGLGSSKEIQKIILPLKHLHFLKSLFLSTQKTFCT